MGFRVVRLCASALCVASLLSCNAKAGDKIRIKEDSSIRFIASVASPEQSQTSVSVVMSPISSENKDKNSVSFKSNSASVEKKDDNSLSFFVTSSLMEDKDKNSASFKALSFLKEKEHKDCTVFDVFPILAEKETYIDFMPFNASSVSPENRIIPVIPPLISDIKPEQTIEEDKNWINRYVAPLDSHIWFLLYLAREADKRSEPTDEIKKMVDSAMTRWVEQDEESIYLDYDGLPIDY